MEVCCVAVCAIAVFALFGGLIVGVIGIITHEINLKALEKSLKDLPLEQLTSRLDRLEDEKSSLGYGWLELSDKEQKQVISDNSALYDEIWVLKKIIKKKKGFSEELKEEQWKPIIKRRADE